MSISANMIVGMFAMFGVGYYVARQRTDDHATVRMIIILCYLMCFMIFYILYGIY